MFHHLPARSVWIGSGLNALSERHTVGQKVFDDAEFVEGRCYTQRVDRDLAASDRDDVNQIAFLKEKVVRSCELLRPETSR